MPNVGHYIVFNYDHESVIVVRGAENQIRSFVNVCRHRGSRICETSGHARGGMLICPYHAWSYGLDGSLAHARMMPREFDKHGFGLTAGADKKIVEENQRGDQGAVLVLSHLPSTGLRIQRPGLPTNL
jgi:phenylpropionate dioxygenase-like ring-hydroxylating dioxygenase large terminal subunit